MTTYSNPRMSATIENWPSGSKRVTAVFSIEQHPSRGERALRTTTGATKKLTYARKMRIVDGDDGRTYIATLTDYGHITIYNGDMKFHHETVFEREPRYAELLELFNIYTAGPDECDTGIALTKAIDATIAEDAPDLDPNAEESLPEYPEQAD